MAWGLDINFFCQSVGYDANVFIRRLVFGYCSGGKEMKYRVMCCGWCIGVKGWFVFCAIWKASCLLVGEELLGHSCHLLLCSCV